MIRGKLYRTDDQTLLLEQVCRTSNPLERMRGLLFRTPLRENEGLLIVPCSAIHTFFMNYSIDLIYLSRDWKVCKTVNSIKPWRFNSAFDAYMVVETIAGMINSMHLEPGTQLTWDETT